MISFKLPTGTLKLSPNTVVELVMNNPLFAEDGKIPGTYTITIAVPNDDDGHNASILGAVNMVENYGFEPNTEVDCTLLFNGVPIEYGKAIAKAGESTESFNLNFVGGLRAVSRDIKDKKLSELNWPTVQLHTVNFGTGSKAEIATGELMQDSIDQAMANIPTAIGNGHFLLNRYKNIGFTDDPGYGGYVNQLSAAGAIQQNGVYAGKQFKYSAGVQISANGGLEYISGQISISVNATTYTTTEASTSLMDKYKQLATMVNAGESATGITLTAVVEKSNFYVNGSGNIQQNGENGHLLIEVINQVDGATDLSDFTTIESDSDWLETDGTFESRYANPYHYCPTFQFSHVFSRIEEDYGIKFIGDFFDDTELQKLAFHTNTSMMVPVTVGDSSVSGEIYGFVQNFNAGNYMPDWTIGQWIREVAFLFGCGVLYHQYTAKVEFVYLNPVVANTNYTDAGKDGIKFSKGQPDRNAYSGVYLKYASATGQTTWVNPNSVTVGTGEKTLESGFQPISDFLGEPDDLKGTPVIFFNGAVSAGQYTATTASATLTYSVEMNSYLNNGIYQKFHQDWIRFLMTRTTLPVSALMQLRHINQLQWTQKAMFDRVKYLYKSLKVRLTMHGLDITEATLYST
ncbi:hypothetical protein GBO34_00840 [Roseivirga pacifica]|uniref:hypothetical protein n=1 Tax=Roseivirga pacifica TaxID=1267423 RepID=UPI00209468A3|nr:hypothetical protein [Roseivirga pacifica]MCO6367859.1 hypothetical protein [Roseivirga pacifica]MCO6377231.1 hypothetical protein [Roseivirga pacifica]